jgi:hypothetical protein
MGQTKQEYLDWLAQQSKCKFCGDAAEDCGCSRSGRTKGEWKAIEDATKRVHIMAVDGDDTQRNVALLSTRSLDEVTANSFLLAAAPDMYEAVLIARSLVNTKLFFHPDDKLAQWEKEVIDKAIAKAEGREDG